MRKAAWILAVVFGIAFLGATVSNAWLIDGARTALARGVFHGRSSATQTRYHLIVILPDSEDSFFRGLLEGIREAAPDADATVQLFRYPAMVAAEVERYYEIAIRSRVDGLVMYVPRNDVDRGRADRAARNGVVFVAVGTDAPDGDTRGFIGSGSLLQGFEGGRIICGSLGTKARIGVILPASAAENPLDEPLYRGLASSIQSFKGASIAAVARVSEDVLSGESAAASILHLHPSVNALFCSSSRDTVGAAQAVIDANLVGSVLIVGADETSEILRYIDRGVVAASIVRDSRWMGREAVSAFSRMKEGLPMASGIEAGFSVRTSKGGAR